MSREFVIRPIRVKAKMFDGGWVVDLPWGLREYLSDEQFHARYEPPQASWDCCACRTPAQVCEGLTEPCCGTCTHRTPAQASDGQPPEAIPARYNADDEPDAWVIPTMGSCGTDLHHNVPAVIVTPTERYCIECGQDFLDHALRRLTGTQARHAALRDAAQALSSACREIALVTGDRRDRPNKRFADAVAALRAVLAKEADR